MVIAFDQINNKFTSKKNNLKIYVYNITFLTERLTYLKKKINHIGISAEYNPDSDSKPSPNAFKYATNRKQRKILAFYILNQLKKCLCK